MLSVVTFISIDIEVEALDFSLRIIKAKKKLLAVLVLNIFTSHRKVKFFIDTGKGIEKFS